MELGWAPAFARKYLNNLGIYLLSPPPLRLLLMTMLLPSDPAAPTCVYPFASYAVGCDAFVSAGFVSILATEESLSTTPTT